MSRLPPNGPRWLSVTVVISAVAIACLHAVPPAAAQFDVAPLQDMQIDANALVLARGGNFSHVINGSPFQQEVLLTHGGYQFATWYSNNADQDIFLSRRAVGGTNWETIDTGYDMEIGNQDWNSHNVISLGISGDGKVHLSYDHHVDPLRYLTTAPGFATSSSQVWSQAGFLPERNSLNSNGSTIPRVTYPRFTNVGDDLVFTYRDYGSGNGDVRIADYDATTGQWSSTRFVNRGRPGNGTYDDVNNNPSDRRNAYHNGFHADSTGRLHTTWTWREGTQDGNHDINYAYSDDKGVTWRNNDGVLVGTNSSPITLNSPGIEVVDLDRRHALLNHQGQIVDPEGNIHALMFHRPKGPTYTNSPFSDRNNSDYHHYYRDPITGDWQVNQFPSSISVGSRPRIGVDSFGHLFGAYIQNDDLVIVGSERVAGGYSDWKVLHRDQSRNFEGTPQIDTKRLLQDGVLSVLIQEETPNPSQTEPSGTPLHVRDFNTITPAVHKLFSNPEDGALRARKMTGEVSGEGLGFVINSNVLEVGQSGAGADPFDRAAVMVFQLPDLGSIEAPFQVARFQGHLTQSVSEESVGGDLYGIGRRDTPEILNSDYFGRSDIADPEAVLLQDDLLGEGMSVDTSFFTSGVGGANLVSFLNEQYAGGAGAGDYVFLRLNSDAESTQRWSLASGNVSNEAHKPQLLFTAIEGDFLDGDYNRDGVVDSVDYAVWRENLGASAGALPNDPIGGTIGAGQLAVWRDNFGATLALPASGAATVPEPGTASYLLVAACASLASWARRVKRQMHVQGCDATNQSVRGRMSPQR